MVQVAGDEVTIVVSREVAEKIYDLTEGGPLEFTNEFFGFIYDLADVVLED